MRDHRKVETLIDAARYALQQMDAIQHSQGWLEARQSGDPGNVTEWIGPRLSNAQMILTTALDGVLADAR